MCRSEAKNISRDEILETLNTRLKSMGFIPKAMDKPGEKEGRRKELLYTSSDPKCSSEILLLIIIIICIDLLSILHNQIREKKKRFMTMF